MKKFVVAVFPSSTSKGLKMSRDVVVEAENNLVAQEMVQGIYPDAKVMVRRELASGSESKFTGEISSDGDVAAQFGKLFGKFIKGYVSPSIQKYLGTSEGVSGFLGVLLLIALIFVAVGIFGFLGVFLPFILFWVLQFISK